MFKIKNVKSIEMQTLIQNIIEIVMRSLLKLSLELQTETIKEII